MFYAKLLASGTLLLLITIPVIRLMPERAKSMAGVAVQLTAVLMFITAVTLMIVGAFGAIWTLPS
jgi:hypothetical protein